VNSEESRAARVAARISAIQGHGDFPPLWNQIREVMSVSQDEDAALDRLAGLVLQHYGLTLRVLRTVNSIYYNRSGQPVLSVARAIVLLGVRTVREMAASYLIFDHYQRRSPELRQLMLLSMITASHAEFLSAWNGKVRPEEAHVCGLFRNLGEVLVANHFPDDYAEILSLCEKNPNDRVDPVVRVLGFRFEDLGAGMSRKWGLPIVGETPLPGGNGLALKAVAELGHELTTLIYRTNPPPTDAAIARLLARYRHEVPVPPDQIRGLIQGAAATVRTVFQGLGASPEELGLLARGDPPAPASPPPEPDGPIRQEYRIGSVRETRTQLLAEVSAAVSSDPFDLNRALLVLLESLTRGGPFDRALFCLIDADRTEIRSRLALGDPSESLGAAFHFPIGAAHNPITRSLADQEPVFLSQNDTGAREARVAKALGAAELAVLPLTVEGHTIGCLYCDRRAAAGPPDPATMMFLGRVQTIAEQVITRSRQQVARV
jgi:HD-like signal output (HDOD) protein